MSIFTENDMLRMMNFAYKQGGLAMQEILNPESVDYDLINEKIYDIDFDMIIWTMCNNDDKVDAIHNMMYNDKYKSIHKSLNIIYDKLIEYRLRNELIVKRGLLK